MLSAFRHDSIFLIAEDFLAVGLDHGKCSKTRQNLDSLAETHRISQAATLDAAIRLLSRHPPYCVQLVRGNLYAETGRLKTRSQCWALEHLAHPCPLVLGNVTICMLTTKFGIQLATTAIIRNTSCRLQLLS